MIVNTGRAASRAFHLNLRAQPGLSVCSRHRLDDVVTEFITARSVGGLDALVADLGDRIDADTLGMVFHGVRPRLAFPFTSSRNVELLAVLRERLGIETAYLVVRDPVEVFTSEMNRRQALAVGDWAFPTGTGGWHRVVEIDRLGDVSANPPPLPLGRLDEVDPVAVAAAMAERTGKAASLAQLYRSVFPDTVIVPYDVFVAHPESVLERMAVHSGFDLLDRGLVSARLNGLGNRLLVYNPVTLAVGRRHVRFRFELGEVIGRCDDWGIHERLDIDCSDHTGAVAEVLGGPVDLGVDRSDLAALDRQSALRVTEPQFLAGLLEAIGPAFVANFLETRESYRTRVYRSEWPEEAWAAFSAENRAEIESTEALLDEARLAFGAGLGVA